MRRVLLARFGEVHLKGNNRPYFLRALVDNVRKAVEDIGGHVWMAESRIYVANATDMDECAERVRKVFGIYSVSPAIEMEKDLDAICRQAAEMYMEENPGRKVCVLDSLSAGPELQLTVELLRDAILAGEAFEEIEAKARMYMLKTHLLFSLQSLANLARNGRVSPAVAKIASVLGICIVGKASDVGTLEPLHKCRGEKSALRTLYKTMKELGFAGGKVRISHCLNEKGAQMVVDMIREEFPAADVIVDCAKGLVCYYAENGGMLIGFEG